QHGTAIVVLAALTNALRVVNKKLDDVRVVISGAGAAGYAIISLLQARGAADIVVCDRNGALHTGMTGLDPTKQWIADNTNSQSRTGDLSETVQGADVFIGGSWTFVLSGEDFVGMDDSAIVFALANPEPEVVSL